MKSTLETLEDNRVKLSVEVDESEFDTAVNAAFKRIAKEVRMPGFRPGKAPRRLLEAQLGHQVGRDEALREAMPEYYTQAVIEHDVDVVGPPDINIPGGQETGVAEFDAVVEVRPTVNAGGYDGLRIEIPSPSPSDEEIDEQLEQMRKHYAKFEVVERAAIDGDHVTIDIAGTHDEEEIPGLTTTDYDYEVGSGAVVAEIDDHLRGASVGDELEFDAEHPDPEEEAPISFAISVKEVKEAVLPELDDAWAAETSEFETIEELRADMVERLSGMRVAQARSAVQQNTAEALAALVLDEIPESMIDNEVNARIQDMVQRLQQQGMDVGAYLEAMGMTAESLAAEFREPAEQAVRVDLGLRSIAEAEGMNPDDEKLDEQLEVMAGMSGQSATELRERLAEVGQLSVLRADLGKQAAMEWLTENVELIDENGDPIDRAALEIPEEDAEGSADSADSTDLPDSPDSVDSTDSEEE
ncbi:MAG: trigger factor [Actinobacteria bacterium]|nr:trigger factor [Actinomycetota bacterium]